MRDYIEEIADLRIRNEELEANLEKLGEIHCKRLYELGDQIREKNKLKAEMEKLIKVLDWYCINSSISEKCKACEALEKHRQGAVK